ncbi:pyrimidine dimer DNA glycosylase/endonuclease V [Candidatus Magnetaquicoccus inordinatus]|uniref:pyrimidine dimer DNA glycosylase/endonuclease V n=1 Tax=Candidatus Magnetaquicoccus inordinatus TaxID=2496818 RepID=UPI00102C1B00|nr:pyrimidine dimer DNA glycosylase/endonuclease V [Candidatus Magnetaquicoccus inordinatus]
MRLWTLHPHYLDSQGLVALWREGLLAQKVLRGESKGYQHHPQLQRFRAQHDPVGAIASFLWAVQQEATRRSYQFNASLICPAPPASPMAETRGQLLYEWQHLLQKLNRRAPQLFALLSPNQQPQPHPLFYIVEGEVCSWERLRSGNLREDKPS